MVSNTTSVPRRYSAEELLALRASLPVVTCPIKNLNQHPDLGSIVYIPEAARKDPEHFSCKSSILVDVTNRKVVARRVADSSTESEPQLVDHVLGKQEPDQRQRWNLRTRSSSDRSSQPRSAPASAVQRSENFQKFYRAVVSPTHVRVTAGGRIVPNTRASAPPPLDWDNAFESTKQPPSTTDPNTPQLQSWQLNAGYTPVLPNVFAPPFIPLPHSNSLPVMAPHFQGYVGTDHNGMPIQRHPTDLGGNSQHSGLIKISPPSQFDASRPFLYNGQLIYPVSAPPVNSAIPITVLNNNGYYTPPMQSTGFTQSQYPVQMPAMPHSMGFTAGNVVSMLAAGANQQAEGVGSVSPLPGMTLTADVLKDQVSLMRSQLKQIEDHISNNRGQADLTFMEQQRTFILSQITSMEAMIDHQRAHEAKGASHNGKVSGPAFAETKQFPAESGYNSPMVVSSSMAEFKKVQTTSKDNSKSKLTLAAAKAPPFEPRSQVVLYQNDQVAPSPSTPDMIRELNNNPQLQAEISARLTAAATSDWTGNPAKNQAYLHLSDGPMLHGGQANKQDQSGYVYGSNTSYEPMKTATEGRFVMPPGSVPYLIGTLPSDFNAGSSQSNEFMYSRPLTEEELRARYLYFGKAPRSIQSGLPKFDGKDFYPPSPVKSKAVVAGQRVATPPQRQDPSFEHLFASPWTVGYVTPPPAAPSSDWVTTGPIPAQPNFQNGQQSHASQQGSSFKTAMNNGTFSQGDDKIKETVIYYKSAQDTSMTPNEAEESGTEDGEDETGTDASWNQRDIEAERKENAQVNTQSILSDDADSTTSSVEINLDTVEQTRREFHNREQQAMREFQQSFQQEMGQLELKVQQAIERQENAKAVEDYENENAELSFQQRVENFKKPEHQQLFLQNILKKEMPMVGSALSGTVSSATAQGYLPAYTGSAAASLYPSTSNLRQSAATSDYVGSKRDSRYVSGNVPVMTTNSLPENRPFNSSAPTSAEGYMRYLSSKDESDRLIVEQGWNSKTTGTGPISGSDW